MVGDAMGKEVVCGSRDGGKNVGKVEVGIGEDMVV